MTWCPVADILLAVIRPQYRATASALQILISHLLGDAGSPYLVGVVSRIIRRFLIGPRSMHGLLGGTV